MADSALGAAERHRPVSQRTVWCDRKGPIKSSVCLSGTAPDPGEERFCSGLNAILSRDPGDRPLLAEAACRTGDRREGVEGFSGSRDASRGRIGCLVLRGS